MRKLALLTLFAAAALFLGGQERAFAHQNHHHASAPQAMAATSSVDVSDVETDKRAFTQVVSASVIHTEKCPYEHDAGCDGCCACGAHASVAIPASSREDYVLARLARESVLAPVFRALQTPHDLTRPPKSFA